MSKPACACKSAAEPQRERRQLAARPRRRAFAKPCDESAPAIHVHAGFVQRSRFTTVQELAARLRGAHADHSVEQVIQEYLEPELVILDELGFTPLDRLLADAFYRIIASRYERSSLIVTSNKSFESWGEVFPDPVIASAILDRLVHHAHLVQIVGDSFRMKDHKTRQKGESTAKK